MQLSLLFCCPRQIRGMQIYQSPPQTLAENKLSLCRKELACQDFTLNMISLGECVSKLNCLGVGFILSVLSSAGNISVSMYAFMDMKWQDVYADHAVNWLDHSRTFREQGVEESETLLLRRKFFYSDQNVDSRDPVQLNLLYVQVNNNVKAI